MLLSVAEQSCIVYHGIEVLHQPCREGINFALTRPEDHTPGAPPPYIQFLSVLGEFSNRLLDVDRTGKKGVLVYLQVSLNSRFWLYLRFTSFWFDRNIFTVMQK